MSGPLRFGKPYFCSAGGPNKGGGAAFWYDGTLNWMTNPGTASALDPNWGGDISTIDCTGIPAGPDLGKASDGSVVALPYGRSMRCANNDPENQPNEAAYRYTGYGSSTVNGQTIQHYSNPSVANSWDPNYTGSVTLSDCTGFQNTAELTSGPSTNANNNPISVRCSTGDPRQADGNGAGSTYLLNQDTNTLNYYPNGNVAGTWDPFYNSNIGSIDCTNLQMGYDLGPLPAAIPGGASVTCSANDPKDGGSYATSGVVYRYTGNNTLSPYPNPPVASSWDPNWENPISMDCGGFRQGQSMPAVGGSVGCIANDPIGHPNSAVYRFMGNSTISYYPTPEIAGSYNPSWSSNIQMMDCRGLNYGGELPMNVPVTFRFDVPLTNSTDSNLNPLPQSRNYVTPSTALNGYCELTCPDNTSFTAAADMSTASCSAGSCQSNGNNETCKGVGQVCCIPTIVSGSVTCTCKTNCNNKCQVSTAWSGPCGDCKSNNPCFCGETDNCGGGSEGGDNGGGTPFGTKSGTSCITGKTPYDNNNYDNYQYTLNWNCYTPKATSSGTGSYYYSSTALQSASTPTVFSNPNPTNADYVTFQVSYNIIVGTTPVQEILNLFSVVTLNSLSNDTQQFNQQAITGLVQNLCTNYPDTFIGTPLCDPNTCGYATAGNNNWKADAISCPSYTSVLGSLTEQYPNYGGWYQYCASNIDSTACQYFYSYNPNTPTGGSAAGVTDSNTKNYLQTICQIQCSGTDPTNPQNVVLLGTGALAGTPTLNAQGAIVSIPVQSGGLYEMDNPPTVVIDAPSSTSTAGQATATVVLTANPNDSTGKTGYVSAFNITNPGYGYTASNFAAPVVGVVVNDTITPAQYNVCGCFLPQAIYNQYQSAFDAANNFTQIGPQPAGCFYPLCVNSAVKDNTAGPLSCTTTYIDCKQSFSPTFNTAGGSVSNVTISNQQNMNCSASITINGTTTTVAAPTSAPANYTPAPASAPANYTPAPASAPANYTPAPAQTPVLLPNLNTIAAQQKKLSAGAVIGIAVGCAVVVIAIILLLLKFVFGII